MKTQLKSWTPHDYQLRALEMMVSQPSVGLFLDPGLGKTSICLSAFSLLRQKGLVEKALVIAPLRPVYSVWPAEIYKWADFNDLTYSIVHGPEKATRLYEDVELYFINPEGLQWLLSQPNLPEWDVLIVDESTKFKHSQTKRFKALKKVLGRFKHRWILTGTPAPNGLMDLFGQIYILDQGASLGRYITHFRNEYFMQTGWKHYNWDTLPGSFERVIEKIDPLILQLNAEDWLEMPDLIKIDLLVELPEPARVAYEQVEKEFYTVLENEEIVAGNAAAAGTKCRQIANGAVYHTENKYAVVHDRKLEALDNLLEELNGHPVLLLYEYRHDRERILDSFPHAVDLKSSGSIRQTIESFNRGDIPLLIGHPASMGHGLNLQGMCHHVIWFGITWNLEHYDQAIARVYRQGQEHDKVFVYHIAAMDTLDERVMAVLQSKKKTQDDLLAALTQGKIKGT